MSDQTIIKQEQFEEALQYIEKMFTDKVSKVYGGQTIFVNLKGFNNQTRHVNTTVSDIIDVCHDLKITWFEKLNQRTSENYQNAIIYSLRLAKPREFKTLKFTPTQTLCFTQSVIALKKGGGLGVCGEKIPIIQNEKIVTSKENEIDYIEEHAFKNPEFESPCSFDHQKMPEDKKRKQKEISVRVQRMIELYYDIINSWAIVYVWNGIAFLFTMEQPFIKEVLKNREKENGRRPIITTIVKRHTRKGNSIGSFVRTSRNDNEPIIMNGRAFHIFIGEESYSAISETKGGRERLKKEIELFGEEATLSPTFFNL